MPRACPCRLWAPEGRLLGVHVLGLSQLEPRGCGGAGWGKSDSPRSPSRVLLDPTPQGTGWMRGWGRMPSQKDGGQAVPSTTMPVAQDLVLSLLCLPEEGGAPSGTLGETRTAAQGGRATLAPQHFVHRPCGFPTAGGLGLLQRPRREAGAAPGVSLGLGDG